MTITTLAIVNGVLVAGLLGALAYVCRIPFGLDRSLARVVPSATSVSSRSRDKLAA